MIISREAFLAAAKAPLPIEKIDVPGLGELFIKGLSGAERDKWEGSLLIGRGKNQRVSHDNIRAKLIVRCLVNEAGERLLTDDDVAVVGGMAASQSAPIYDKAAELSGLSERDLDDLKKSLEMAAGSDSPTS